MSPLSLTRMWRPSPIPPSYTTSAQKPAGSVKPPLSASHDGKPPAFAVDIGDGFGVAGAWPLTVTELAAPRHIITSAHITLFMVSLVSVGGATLIGLNTVPIT